MTLSMTKRITTTKTMTTTKLTMTTIKTMTPYKMSDVFGLKWGSKLERAERGK